MDRKTLEICVRFGFLEPQAIVHFNLGHLSEGRLDREGSCDHSRQAAEIYWKLGNDQEADAALHAVEAMKA